MAASLILRTVKGTPLTNLEVDNNFSNLSTFANTVDSNIGVLSALTTTNTSNIVFAVNSIKAGNLSQFGATTSADLRALVSDETGTGNLVFSSGPTITLTNATGLPLTTGIVGLGDNQTTLLNANAVSGVTASTYGGGTAIPIITVDTYGRVTSASNVSVISGLSITNDTTTDNTYYLAFTTSSSSTIAGANVSTSKLTFNPSSGLLTSTDYNSSSDMALKENISTIENPLDIISKLTGFGFNWKDSGQKSYGLSAQQVEEVLPEIVRTRPDGYKGINYLNLVAFLVEAIKDLKQEITELKSK